MLLKICKSHIRDEGDILSMVFPTDTCTVGNFKVHVITDDQYIAKTLRDGTEWDRYQKDQMDYIYVPGTDILDIGANIGWNSLMYSDYGPVHSFEPVFHEIVTMNVQSNATAHPITVYPFGLSSEKKEDVPMFLPLMDGNLRNYGGTTLHPHNHESTPVYVQLQKLDDVYSGTTSVIKLDVEGHELEVLKGAKNTILKNKPSIYAEIWDHEKDHKLVEFLRDLGYVKIKEMPEHNYLFLSPKFYVTPVVNKEH